MDPGTGKRLFFQVLEGEATQEAVLAFFRRFQDLLPVRHLTVQGITTDGSPLYPPAIQAVWGAIPHQSCTFHFLRKVNEQVLGVMAQFRKRLAAQKPKLRPGRPTRELRPIAQHRQRLEQKIADLYEHRYLLVQRHLTAGERATFQRMTRGLPDVRRLREITEAVYRLFDRRCRTDTALAKLARLRQRVERFALGSQHLRKLFSQVAESTLTFLDERRLGATSNAVERSNRRYRKMQKTIYRVRTYSHIVARFALDLFREAGLQPRRATLNLLHTQRTPSCGSR